MILVSSELETERLASKVKKGRRLKASDQRAHVIGECIGSSTAFTPPFKAKEEPK